MTKLSDTKKKIRKRLSSTWPFIKKHAVMLGLYFLIVLFFINAIIMTLYFINRSYDYKIVDNLYIRAVTPDQDLPVVKTNIVKINELQIGELTTNDKIVICCDFNTEEYWVEDVVSVDVPNQTVVVTYDDVTSTQVTEEDIFGVYVEEANFVGTVYYTSMYLEGYLFLLASQIIIIALYYTVVVKKILRSLWEEKHQLNEVGDEKFKENT